MHPSIRSGNPGLFIRLAVTLVLLSVVPAAASDWEEEKGASAPDKPPESFEQIEPLKGYLQESGKKTGYSEPQTPTPDQSGGQLDARAIDDELRGMIQDGSLKPLSGLYGDPNKRQLEGAVQTPGGGGLMDPDAEDRDLMVEWDRWRNRFLRAVQLGVQEIVNNPDPEDYERPKVDPQTGRLLPRFPMGTGAAFAVLVTRDGRITQLDIIESSGFPTYDRAVVRAIRQLEGTRILNFPKASKRQSVDQAGRIKTAATSDFQYHHFGDVERVRAGQ